MKLCIRGKDFALLHGLDLDRGGLVPYYSVINRSVDRLHRPNINFYKIIGYPAAISVI